MRRSTPIIGIGLALSCFLLGSAGYLLVSKLFGYAFGGFYRMFMYHEEHPFQYIAIVSVVFGFVGMFWLKVFGKTMGMRRWCSIFAAIGLTIVVASIPGGILWKIHDMQAGYFTQGERFWEDLLWGARQGLMLGWLVILASIPYNLIGIGIGALILHRLASIEARMNKKDPK
jgi:hypothetical protein